MFNTTVFKTSSDECFMHIEQIITVLRKKGLASVEMGNIVGKKNRPAPSLESQIVVSLLHVSIVEIVTLKYPFTFMEILELFIFIIYFNFGLCEDVK